MRTKARPIFFVLVAAVVSMAFTSSARAGPRVYEDDEGRWVELGFLIQLQYRLDKPEGSEAENDLWARRLRPMIAAGFHDDWQGIVELGFGAGADGETYAVSLRWVSIQYVGVQSSRLSVGSFKNWFSREFNTSSSRLQIIERTFVGDNAFGNPGYTIGIAWDQVIADDRVFYAANIGAQNVGTDASQMAFRSPANGDSTDNRGWSAAARIDVYAVGGAVYSKEPYSYKLSPYDRSDLEDSRSWVVSFSLGGYAWWNQNNNDGLCPNPDPTSCVDLQNAFGAETSAGIRGRGLSADLEYQFIRGNAVDGAYTGGLYVDGTTNLHKATANAGFMVLPRHLEVYGGWSILNASNYDVPWNRAIIGLSGFVQSYHIRFSADYTREINRAGAGGAEDANVFRTQAQLSW